LTIEILPPGSGEGNQDALALLATGRGTLAFLLGEQEARFRLFSGGVNWNRVFLARLDGRIVGFLAFQWERKGPYASALSDFSREFGKVSGFFRWGLYSLLEWRTWWRGFYVYGLKTIPKARRRGVASALLKAAECYANNLGAKAVELEVHDANERALAFYRAQGYHVGGVWRLGVMRRLLGFSAVFRLVKSLR